MSFRERGGSSSFSGKEKPRHKKKIGSTIGAAVLVAGLAGCSVKFDSESSEIEISTIEQLDSCPSVSSSEVASVSRVLNRPDNPVVKKAYQKGITPEFKEFVKKKAKENNLTLIDNTPYEKRLGKAKTVDQAVDVVNDFSSQYGFELTIDTPDQSGPEEVRPFNSANDIDVKRFKKGARVFMEQFSYAPTEYVKESGVKNVKVADSLMKGWAWGLYYSDDNIYLADDAFYNYGDTLVHEIYHGVDAQMCGDDAGIDAKLSKINPKDFAYGRHNKGALGNVIAEEYGQTNIAEDKATISEKLFPNIEPIIFQNNGPLRVKAETLLARVQQKVQEEHPDANLIGYLRDISSNKQYE